MNRKRKLIFLILILAALALLLIFQLLLAIPVERIALKAPFGERENKDILERTQWLTLTVNSIYAQVDQTLTALPLAGTENSERTQAPEPEETIINNGPTPEPEETSINNSPTPHPSRTQTQISPLRTATPDSVRRTPTPTFTPKPTRTANLTPQTASPGGNIPGLTPDIVISFLANGLFECQAEQIDPLGIHYWSCIQSAEEHEILVTIYARTQDTVDMIEVIAIPSTDPISHTTISKIALIASLPYINADQQAAQDWILDNIPDLAGQVEPEADKIIGNVYFYLIYDDPDWIFYLGDLFQD